MVVALGLLGLVWGEVKGDEIVAFWIRVGLWG